MVVEWWRGEWVVWEGEGKWEGRCELSFELLAASERWVWWVASKQADRHAGRHLATFIILSLLLLLPLLFTH